MAQTSLKMIPNLLTAAQVKYELMIRGLFKTSDNQTRRCRQLESALNNEDGAAAGEYDFSQINMEINVGETAQSYNELIDFINREGAITQQNVKEIESKAVHIMRRIENMQRLKIQHDFSEHMQNLVKIQIDIVEYYASQTVPMPNVEPPVTPYASPQASPIITSQNQFSGPSLTIPSQTQNKNTGTLPRVSQTNHFGHTAHTVNMNPNPIISHGQYLSQHPPLNTNYNGNPNGNNTVNVNTNNQMNSNQLPLDMNVLRQMINQSVTNAINQQLHNFQHQQRSVYNPPTYATHDGHGGDPYRSFATHHNQRSHFRNSSTYPIYRNEPTPMRINVLEWQFYFSGLNPSEDPKSIDVESFLHKIRDHMRAEGIEPNEMLDKVQQLLRGPASDWYAYASRNIYTWQEFTQKIRNRFSSTNTVDALRQLIYSKKQKPGEYTLRFVDQFMNLINRLPEPVDDRQCVNYILGGIRVEIARMARAANIQNVERLVDFIKQNYGQNDKFEPRFSQTKPFQPFTSDGKNRNPKMRVEYLSDEENSLSDVEDCDVEINQMSNKSRFNSNEKSKNTSHDARTNVKQNSLFFLPKTEERKSKFSCPFCSEMHSYKECPLPADQKYIHCFNCKSVHHLADSCPLKKHLIKDDSSEKIGEKSKSVQKQNNEVCTISDSPSDSDLNEETFLSCIPEFTFIESLIFFPKNDLRPHAITLVNGEYVNGLLDTGSHATVIGQNLYESKEWNAKLLPYDTTVITADGSHHRVLGAMLLSYTLNEQTRVVPTLVMPYVMKKPIFGINFQRIFNIGLVFLESNSIEIDSSKEQNVYESHILTPEQNEQLDSVIKTLPVVSEQGVLNCTNKIEHNIDTGDAKPVYSKPYIFSPKVQDKLRDEIKRLIDRDIIERVPESSWLNPVVPVPKQEGVVRLCIDARKLNAVTKKNCYTPMNIDRIFAQISKARYFSSIDLKDAYYQIPLAKQDQQKTAFSIHGMGIFTYKRMPQGLINSAASLCRLVETVFNVENEPEIFVYIDDFIICTETFERHIELLTTVASKLKEIGLAIGLKKSHFCMKKLKFLGHVIDENGLSVDTSRLQAITTYKKPTNVTEVQSFLGFTGWYRKFIENYAEIATPLVNLTKKSSKFIWTKLHEEAYEGIKSKFLEAPILHMPNYTKPFIIDSKSSDIAISAALYQMNGTEKQPIAFMSAKLNTLQQKYHLVERECLSLILALEKFRLYIQGSRVTVNTDYNSLQWLKNYKDPTGRIARWALRLQAYDFEVKYKRFSKYDPVCVLSQNIDPQCTPWANIEMNTSELLNLSESMLITATENKIAIPHEICIVEMLTNPIDYIANEICALKTDRNTNKKIEWYTKTFESVREGQSNEYFKIENDILYHRFDKIKNPFENEWKICVPIENRIEKIYEQHDSILASHPGYFRTLNRLQNLYYWPKMARQIYEYVGKCEICRTTKSSNVNPNLQNGSRRETDYPFRSLSSDFIGPLPMTKQQNQYLFVVVDNFSKYVWIKPLRTATAKNIIHFIEEEIFLKFGVCESMICDNGVQFISKDLGILMNKYKAKLIFTPLYHPQANPCEIVNKSIGNALRSYCAQSENQRTWDVGIAAIACALNTHVHTSTKMAPYFAIFGHNMIVDGKKYEQVVDANSPNNLMSPDKFQAIRQSIREHLQNSYERSVKNMNKRASTRKFDVNGDIYLKNVKLSNAGERYSKKLGLKYIPVKITQCLGKNTYLVSDRNGKILGKYHESMLIQR